MPKKNPTIVFANAKGGSGKSSLACSLAAELVKRGQRVTLLDADPAGGMSTWHAVGGPLAALRLVVEPSTRVTSVARKEAESATVVLDAAGFATSTMVGVLEAADIVLIPCRASPLDALRAIETVRMAQEVAKARGKRIPIRVVLNAVTNTAVVPHIRSELERVGASVAEAEIRQRTAFPLAALSGSAPCWMGYSAEKAAAEVAALADELNL